MPVCDIDGIHLIGAERYGEDPVESLDVTILQRDILEPILGIKDPKVDERIDFVGGIRGLEELVRRVHTDAAAAFAMYPTDIHELFAVSDAGSDARLRYRWHPPAQTPAGYAPPLPSAMCVWWGRNPAGRGAKERSACI